MDDCAIWFSIDVFWIGLGHDRKTNQENIDSFPTSFLGHSLALYVGCNAFWQDAIGVF